MPCKNCAVSIHYVALGLKYCPWCGLELNPRCPDLSKCQPSPFADRICDSIMRNGGTDADTQAGQPQQPQGEICRYYQRELAVVDGVPVVQHFCRSAGKLSPVR